MRRLLLLAPLLLFTASCGIAPSSEGRATDDARETARKAAQQLYSQLPRTADEVGHAATGVNGVEVLQLTGTSTHDGRGIDLVVRTSGSGTGAGPDSPEVTVQRCFAIRASPRTDWNEPPRDVGCPDGAPLGFPVPKAAAPPYEELRSKLPRVPEGGRADEAEVRRVLAALSLQPTVRIEVKADGERVGVVLTKERNGSDPQDCVLAVIGPGATDVWAPSLMQRMPGENGCTVDNALHPQPAPH
jgi:hypothetical protein